MTQTLNFAIVGTGSIAGHFFKSITELDDCKVSAVCSSSPERALIAEEKFGVKAYYDVDTMLDKAEVDVVCICTASGDHLEPALAAASRGKHVLCEKPLEINLSRIDQMISACKSADVKLGCIFQNRYSEDFLRLHKAVLGGMLGKLVAVNAFVQWYRDDAYYGDSPWRGTLKGDGGGALINQGIHTVDLFQLIGGKISEVHGVVRTTTHDIEGEDLAMGTVVFENGALGQIQASTSMWPGYPERLEVFGEKGSIILEGGRLKYWNIQGVPPFEKQEEKKGGSGSSDPMAISHQLHKTQIEDFANAIRTGGDPAIDGAEGRKSVALIEAIFRSSVEHKIVKF